MQRNFEPMRKQIQAWRGTQITDADARLVIYKAFIEGELEAQRYLALKVHQLHFNPPYPEFSRQERLELFECVHLRVQGA
jgi:hypothetical protein